MDAVWEEIIMNTKIYGTVSLETEVDLLLMAISRVGSKGAKINHRKRNISKVPLMLGDTAGSEHLKGVKDSYDELNHRWEGRIIRKLFREPRVTDVVFPIPSVEVLLD